MAANGRAHQTGERDEMITYLLRRVKGGREGKGVVPCCWMTDGVTGLTSARGGRGILLQEGR